MWRDGRRFEDSFEIGVRQAAPFLGNGLKASPFPLPLEAQPTFGQPWRPLAADRDPTVIGAPILVLRRCIHPVSASIVAPPVVRPRRDVEDEPVGPFGVGELPVSHSAGIGVHGRCQSGPFGQSSPPFSLDEALPPGGTRRA
jgi:hypothetical protein